MNNSARFSTLVTSGNQNLAPNINNILVGQLGVYNAQTNADITTAAQARRDGFYIAVGIDKDNDNIVDNIKKSFNVIYPQNVISYSIKNATSHNRGIIEVVATNVTYATDYLLKLEIKSNSLFVFESQRAYTKLISYRTEDCPVITNCTYPDYFLMVKSILNQIRNDEKINGFIDVIPFNPTNPAVEFTTDAQLSAFIASNPGVFPGLRFYIYKPKYNPPVNELYYYSNPREVEVMIIPVAGFEQNCTVTEVQKQTYEQTSGIDVMELERMSTGWEGEPGPYKEYDFGTKKIDYTAKQNILYTLITIHYKYNSQSGTLNYSNDEMVIIAIPSTDNTTLNAITTRLNTLLT